MFAQIDHKFSYSSIRLHENFYIAHQSPLPLLNGDVTPPHFSTINDITGGRILFLLNKNTKVLTNAHTITSH